MKVYLLGFLFDWRTTCWICSCGPLLLSLAMWWCWETPYWLVEQGRGEEARASLQWYRGPHYDTTLEIEEIVRSWEQKQVRCDWSRVELCSTPSVPQPVVQSRRRPLLGPSPG